MPGRQSHGAPPSKKSKVRNNNKKRGLNAFAIASHETPDDFKIRQHRLGAQEGGNRPVKRRRTDDEDENDEEEAEPKKQRKMSQKGRFDELDIERGSDSDGNEWMLGQVDSDDDSDLDSDEAFGESDEERFEGFAFSGSSDKKAKKKLKPRTKDMNLDEEDEGSASDSELEEGDLGEDAVDLATMLDMAEAEEEEEKRGGDKTQDGSPSESEEEDDSESDDEDSSVSSADDDDDETADPAKIAALQKMIANLPQADDISRLPKRRSDGANEYATPSDFGLTSNDKLTLEDLGLPAISDPHIKKSLKFVESESKGKKKTAALEVPLARRQQDRLDRAAAYEKSKETLDRWTDTVAHNRRAEHLMFPLPDQEMLSAKRNDKLVPTSQVKPFNELEATIQSILEESGLASGNGKDDEDHLREYEELETKKMSIEEVRARRDQLRKARDLMFREEAKAKRIKKIKSKSYRKVHRKQREKEERLFEEEREELGIELSEDEREAQDRRRAMERMGARHRGSRWAKATKAIGRAAWDDDARDGIIDMARRDEELRKRFEGKVVRKEIGGDSEASSSDSEEDLSDNDEDDYHRQLHQLDQISGFQPIDESVPGGRLANMKFMRKADEARRKQNDETIESMRRELAGEESPSEEEEEGDIGRRIFGPGSTKDQEKSKKPKANQFEEPEGSEVEDEDDHMEVDIRGLDNDPNGMLTTSKSQTKTTRNQGASPAEPQPQATKQKGFKGSKAVSIAQVTTTLPPAKPKKSQKPSRTATTILNAGSGDSSEDEDPDAGFIDKFKLAFAGADVAREFEDEKKAVVAEDDDKIIDNTLPGWGSWTGDGISKREKARNKGRFLQKVEGVKEKDRKDAKLDRVIINEKKQKKFNKYLAETLPHPFETRQQYERSLRIPVGPEWTTKETYQDATKPRVLLKQGIIAPMSQPLL